MDYDLEISTSYCVVKFFEINGIEATADDFGSHVDESRKTAPPYGCGNHVFRIQPCSSEVCAKYKITEDEYEQLADELSSQLSFGRCTLCE